MLYAFKMRIKIAQIITIDGERHNVKETYEELKDIMTHSEVLELGIVRLNWYVEILRFENGKETTIRKFEPVSFICRNIMMYY